LLLLVKLCPRCESRTAKRVEEKYIVAPSRIFDRPHWLFHLLFAQACRAPMVADLAAILSGIDLEYRASGQKPGSAEYRAAL